MLVKVYINGEILDENKATISIFDRGFLYGDGIFETMRSYNGIVFRLGEHLKRFYSSMKSLKMKKRLSDKEIEKIIYELLRVNNLKDASIKVIASRGISEKRKFSISQSEASNTVITVAEFLQRPVKYYTEGIKVDIARFRRSSASPSLRFKTLNYLDSIIARSDAVPTGSFETIFLNELGHVCEGSVSNIFMVKGNRLMTPSLSCGILQGVTRKTVLELLPYAGLGIEEGGFGEEELKSSEEVFITNSLIEIIPVTAIDGRIVGDGKVGKITRKIHELYKDLIKEATGSS